MTDESREAASLAQASANATAAQALRAIREERRKDTRTHAELKADALRNRAELAATLDAIEYRVNVPKRVSNRLRVLREENPAALAAIGVAIVAVVGVAVWLGVRSFGNRMDP